MDKIYMLISILEEIPDYRQQGKVHHPLVSLVFSAIVATIAGADDWECIEEFVIERMEWLNKYVSFPYGAPSHDTYERVFQRIDPKLMLQSFQQWTNLFTSIIKGGVVAIDGKTMCGTKNELTGKKALHIVSAWFSETGMVLGQIKTEEKSNEITAIPELLDILDVTGCIVTIDAMGTQYDIADKIIDKKADYVLSLKGNHPLLHEEVVNLFEKAREAQYRQEHKINTFKQLEKGHGRIECREAFITSEIQWMKEAKRNWRELKSIGMIIYSREESTVKTTEYRYFLCSIPADAEKFANAVRKHWGIESMHWSLDTTFNEDSKRVRKDNAPENLAIMLKFAYNYLKKETTFKKSLRKKRFKASLNLHYLESILDLI